MTKKAVDKVKDFNKLVDENADNELAQKLVQLALFQQLDNQKLIVSYYERELKYLNIIYENMQSSKPWKIFSKSYLIWKKNIKIIFGHITKLEEELGEEYQELEKLLEACYKDKKNKDNN